MKNECNSPYGAFIERGQVTAAKEDGYIVESYDRPGVITPPIKGMNNEEHSAGDRVFFFLFNDGDGKIIGKLD